MDGIVCTGMAACWLPAIVRCQSFRKTMKSQDVDSILQYRSAVSRSVRISLVRQHGLTSGKTTEAK
jgi:hypothetical protein